MTLATSSKPYVIDPAPSTQAEMDAALQALHVNKHVWVRADISERLALLDATTKTLRANIEPIVQAGQAAKRIPPGHPGNADDWVFVTLLFRQLKLLRQSLRGIQANGLPRQPGPFYQRENGQVVAPVFPNNMMDRLLYNGMKGEIWFRPGVTKQAIRQGQARHYRSTGHRGRVCLVLGAGNLVGLIPGDFLYKLFAEDQVVALKMNPVNEYLGPLIEKAYQPFVDRGFLQVLYGGVEEATYLIEHNQVDELHITGSDKTHDAIVFGVGEEAERRKRERNPRMTKRFTSELGNVTPVIVVPGPWDANDIALQADHLAGQLVVNAGFNCLTPRVIIQQAGWQHREALNKGIGAALADVPTRYAYYPGAAERHAAFTGQHPEAKTYGDADEGELPWTYIPGLDPSKNEDIAFQTEAFCSVMAETTLNAPTPADFIDQAVDFANSKLWGTLTAMIIIHPASLEDPTTRAAYKRALDNLRYGTICVNVSTAFGYVAMHTAWGGHSGSDVFDVQSGIGFVNNLLFFDDDHIQKSVVEAPFRSVLSNQSISDPSFVGLAEGILRLEAGQRLQGVLAFTRALRP